ncbi:uncharacterized protein K444DRAFT_92956 [Hyaloscypha bicolor E]|uniref:Uncharacterized protein n=1 Tax=Hyaloscypha bicolor E TaxID=1095630 RepID=A0A2J6SVT7_9HELO|nr:uncharacterized protein K444DRAFT_92956 [Hyaloscypha bicolor E]PMD54891.1 hypothetical protein K444DRAFT_92956 [Hyaloscypha bicolor E]
MKSTANTDLELGVISASSTLRGSPPVQPSPSKTKTQPSTANSNISVLAIFYANRASCIHSTCNCKSWTKPTQRTMKTKAARDRSNYCNPTNLQASEHQGFTGDNQAEELKHTAHETLLLESQVLALRESASRTLRGFKRWFASAGTSKRAISVSCGEKINAFSTMSMISSHRHLSRLIA